MLNRQRTDGRLKRHLPPYVLACVAIVCGLWVFFYFSYSTHGLPLGWDTPYYIWRIHSAANSGIAAFVTSERYYDFLYPLVGSWISPAGVPAFQAEIIRPLLLWIVCVLVIVAIVRREIADAWAPFIAASAGSTWFALFRLSADPHANLLALAIMLCGTWVFLRAETEASPRRFTFMLLSLGGIVFLSSITHIETTIFLSAVWVLALFLVLRQRLLKIRRFLAILTTISLSLLPGTVIFYFQLQWVATGLQGRLPSIATMGFPTWLLYLGPVGLSALIMLGLSYYFRLSRISSPIIAFTFAWLTLSLTIGFAQYINNSFTPFSERAIILTPTPFVASVIIPKLAPYRITRQMKGIGMISLVILGVGTLYLVGVGYRFYNTFISDSAAGSLQYLQSSGILDMKNSVFIFSDPPDTPGSGNHNSYWVGAYLGDHYSYLGRIDFIMAGIETPFTADQAAQISTQFFDSLPLNQVNNMAIVYIPDFNYPNPPPVFYRAFLNSIGGNVFEVNRTAWNPSLVLFPAYSSFLSSTGSWYWKPDSLDQSGNSLELNTTRPSQPANVSFAFVAPRNGNYTVSLKLLDEPASNPVSMLLDGANVKQLSYTGTTNPLNVTIFSGSLTKGVHTIDVSVGHQSNIPQLASLDYFSVKQI